MLIVFAALMVANMAWGQEASPAYRLEGRVLDATGAAIAGARIVAAPAGALGSPAETLSDMSGNFSLPLGLGQFSVRVSADGFQEYSTGVTIEPEIAPVHTLASIVLQVEPHREAVEVTEPLSGPGMIVSQTTKTPTPLRDVPQSVTLVPQDVIRDMSMQSMADVVQYMPGIGAHQGENNRDQVVIRGNSSSADFFLNGVRDDVQYYRDLYDLDRVEALKGSNALLFGRGGAGGVINRVTKEAGFTPLHELTLQTGSFTNRRFTTDFDQPLGDRVAVRLNGLYENSGTFRDFGSLERYGISPTATFAASDRTKIEVSYQFFRDRRTADRGIPSFQGLPLNISRSTYFGDPDQSRVRARVHIGLITVEHQMGKVNFRNNTLIGDYDRGYQNFVPGAVTANGQQDSLSAYNNATARRNIFNQTDLGYSFTTGVFRHNLLVGSELGRQLTDNLRNTGFFNGTATSLLIPTNDPTISVPMVFQQSATDANNHLVAVVAAGYAQDEINLTRQFQVIAGVRFDRFDLNFHNNRDNTNIRRVDVMASPRAGIVWKPVTPVSVYASYGVSYLPASGDQFSSLTSVTEALKPERFNNYEVGAKWGVRRSLFVTGAVYRLDRVNTRATDPNDPTKTVQTGSQRTNGFELGISGRITPNWRITGGYAYQDAFVTSATTSAIAGAQVGLVPHQTVSLWNSYHFLSRWEAGLGLIQRTKMFAAIDNTVTLPGYVRADAAVFYSLTERIRLQANIENVLDRTYYIDADSNTNISPGSPRAVRLGMMMRF